MSLAAHQYGKTRQAVKDALFVDAGDVQPAVARGLYAVAQEVDEQAELSSLRHIEVMKALKTMTNVMISATLTLITTMAGLIAFFLQR